MANTKGLQMPSETPARETQFICLMLFVTSPPSCPLQGCPLLQPFTRDHHAPYLTHPTWTSPASQGRLSTHPNLCRPRPTTRPRPLPPLPYNSPLPPTTPPQGPALILAPPSDRPPPFGSQGRQTHSRRSDTARHVVT
ncbi:hypothetical protein LEMLEM_LOCUS194 [Lemmus lemmus]